MLGYPATYRYEGIAFYSYPNQISGSSPVYRFYDVRAGGSLLHRAASRSTARCLRMRRSSFRFEGVAYYALPNLTDTSAGRAPVLQVPAGCPLLHEQPGRSRHSLMREATDTYRYEDVAYFLPDTAQRSSAWATRPPNPSCSHRRSRCFRSEYSGVASRFAVTLKEAGTGATFAALENFVGSISDHRCPGRRHGESICARHRRVEGSWSITIEQPKSVCRIRSPASPAPARLRRPCFSMLQGSKTDLVQPRWRRPISSVIAIGWACRGSPQRRLLVRLTSKSLVGRPAEVRQYQHLLLVLLPRRWQEWPTPQLGGSTSNDFLCDVQTVSA